MRSKLLKDKLSGGVLAAITPLTVKEFRDMRLETVKSDTVRKEMSLLSTLSKSISCTSFPRPTEFSRLKLAQQEWDIYLPRGNPVDSVGLLPKGKGRDRRLQLGEEECLLKEAKEYGGYIEDLIHLALETGARRGELVNLQWTNINMLKGCRIH